MYVEIMMEVIKNAALLLALSIIYEISYLIPTKRKRLTLVINGSLIGLIGVAVMTLPFRFSADVIFDTRSILIGVTALTFGPLPTVIAASMISLYRIIIGGGASVFAGVAVTVSCAVLGLLWRHFMLNKSHYRWLNIYLFGICIHVVMLLCMFILPWPLSVQVLEAISLPILLIYPVATVLLSLLLLQQKERKEALIQIVVAEERYKSLFDNNHATMLLIDPDNGDIIDANLAASQFYGWPIQTIRSMNISQINTLTPEEVKVEMKKSADKRRSQFQFKHRIAKGQVIDVEVYSGPIPLDGRTMIYSIVHDIRERVASENALREVEAQLRQQQKLEAIGTLAGGVAHEINNPIYGIINYAQLILDSIDHNTQNAEYAKEIIHESERVSTIVKNLLQFSRQEKQSHSYAKIEDIIDQTLSLIRTIIRKDQITLDIDLEQELPEIKCRSQQIQQIIMNLLINAKDALNERYPDYHEDKIIHIACNQFTFEDQPWLRITIEDHGNGIPVEVQEKIFEPFFSTKPKDKGTGLGLSISFGIVKDHHGRLTLDTKQGSYTRMYLDLPVDNGWVI